ncbi:MAG: ferrous iron transporter B [Deltaproteobacteria bacterium]|nr:ferrous iron transporter B [Deltaproteobacteria bacterium]
MTVDVRQFLILGNVKVGKTTIFERLAGNRKFDADVSTRGVALRAAELGYSSRKLLFKAKAFFTGKGESRKAGQSYPDIVLIDGPGASSLISEGEDETCCRDLLLEGKIDGLLLVADPRNLRRALMLLLQIVAFDLPVVMALNMEDEAQSQGIFVDREELSKQTGIDVVATVASEGHGLHRIPAMLHKAERSKIKPKYPVVVEEALNDLEKILSAAPIRPRGLALMLLADMSKAWEILKNNFGRGVEREVKRIVSKVSDALSRPASVVITESLYDQAGVLTSQVVQKKEGYKLPGALGRAAEHPLWGLPIAAVVLAVGYLFVGEFGAGMVVDAIDVHLFKELLLPFTEHALSFIPWQIVKDALFDPDFGLVPTGLFLALGLVMPVLFFFYLYFALLEDSGYLPRLSVLLDKILRKMGLNGKGVLPLVLGFSCVTMALLTTRILDTKKERIIASLLLILGFPCAPLLAVMLVVLKPLSIYAALTIFGWLAVQVLVFGMLANKLIKGEKAEFILEIPPLRRPSFMPVLARTGRRTVLFIREALPIFLFASLLMFTLDRLGTLNWLEDLSRPVVHGVLGLPDQAVQVFFKTFIRRENGAAELDLVRSHFDSVQVLVTLLVMTVFTPCMNSTIVLFKEQGIKVATAILVFVSIYGILAGGVLNWICRTFSITFT